MIRASFASCSALLLAVRSFAVEEVSNLAEPLFVEFTANGVHFTHASSFTTGAAATGLDSITVSVFTNTSGSSELRLRADAGGAPGALIESLGTVTLPSNQGNVLRTYPSVGTTLAANTTYWVTLGETGSGDFQWDATTSTNQTSPSGWTIGDQTFFHAAGSSTWLPVSFGPPNESAKLAVEAHALSVPAPEPIDWVVIANPGNACNNLSNGCYGAVANTYLISRYEVTNTLFAEFLNAIADSDPNGIYNSAMSISITRSGSPGSYVYTLVVGREDMPAAAMSYYDTLRFANWLHNDRPSGAQDASTTEDGAYTFTGPTTAGARNPGARYALPTENEWFKAAYYNPATATYFIWPTGTNATPTCSPPSALPNRANCGAGGGMFTDVGSYTGSPSPYGTFDQGGNVFEWNDTLIGSERGMRGGSWNPSFPVTTMASLSRFSLNPITEGDDNNLVGFRVVPEPGAALQLASGSAVLLALARRSARGRNRRRARTDRSRLD